MIDLKAVVRAFADVAIKFSLSNQELDQGAINSTHTKDQTNRAHSLGTWLERYAVFQGFNNEQRENLVKKILEFADAIGCDLNSASYDKLLTRHRLLHKNLEQLVPITKKGKPRDLTSLTSKAHWVCYPNAVPIHDRYAQSALWVMSKLSKHGPRRYAKNGKYETFADVWLTMYEEVKNVIEESDLKGYQYRLRVFDRILWIIGRPAYSGDPGLQRLLRKSLLRAASTTGLRCRQPSKQEIQWPGQRS